MDRERLAHEYATSRPITFEAQSAPEVVETVEIEGRQVEIVRYATLTMPRHSSEPTFGRTDRFYAIRAGAEVYPLSRVFYLHDGGSHRAGDATGGRVVASAKRGELGSSTTVKGALKAARDRIERDRLWAQYAPVAEKNIATHTLAYFEGLDADAEIEVGDLVVVYSHQRYRTGVAIKVTPTKVECIAGAPTNGNLNGITSKKGQGVRLLRKATPAAPAPVESAAEQDTPAEPTPAALVGQAIQARAERAEQDRAADRAQTAERFTEGRAAAADFPRTPRGRWAAGLPAQPTAEWREGLEAAAADFRADRDSRAAGASCPVHAVLLAGCPHPNPASTYAAAAEPALDGAAPAAPVLDEDEERRATAGRVFARAEGMTDADGGCTLYRVVRARVGAGIIRIHDAGGELLGTVAETAAHFGAGWRAETPGGEVIPAGGVESHGLFETFAGAVDAVRAAAANEDDDQAATGAAGEDESMAEMTPADAEGWGLANEEGPESRDCVRVSVRRTPAGGREQWCATHRAYEPIEDEDDAPAAADPVAELLALVVERGITPATLRAVADQVERDQAGHVTEIEVNSVRVFSWGCRSCHAEGVGFEVGEEAYREATAHGPLVATSPFVRGEVIEHEGRGDNEHGVPRRTLGGALQWEMYDGGEWVLMGYGRTADIDEGDIAGAQAWAAAAMVAGDYDRESVEVARWEHHRDRYGEWWEPVTR